MVLIHEETSWQAVIVAAYRKWRTTELHHTSNALQQWIPSVDSITLRLGLLHRSGCVKPFLYKQ